MHRLARPVFVVALAVGAMIAIGGAALPASAASAHATPLDSSSTPAVSVTAGSCSFTVTTHAYVSKYGYETVQVWYSQSSCSSLPLLEAGVTCYNSSATAYVNMWGSATTTLGSSYFSQAACNSAWPSFYGGGGFRIYIDGAWQYHTELVE
jgi:hypothetical protein